LATLDKNQSLWSGKFGPMLIAEIGGNHEGDFNYAKKLVDLAIDSNVDVIKFQIYKAKTLVNKKLSLDRFNHFKKFELTKKQIIYLADKCLEANLKYSASIWDFNSFEWLKKKINYIKIGSGDLTCYQIINNALRLEKPIILSTGLSNVYEIKKTLSFIKKKNFYNLKKNYIALLHFTSSYPCPSEDINLNAMINLNKMGYPVGYSHHHIKIYPLEIAYILGAQILEFHFTDKKQGKVFRDHKVSLTNDNVKNFIKKIKNINSYKGSYKKTLVDSEISAGHHLSFRRGLYLKKQLKKNEKVLEKNLISLRPKTQDGLDSTEYFKLIGRKAKKNISAFQILKRNYFY